MRHGRLTAVRANAARQRTTPGGGERSTDLSQDRFKSTQRCWGSLPVVASPLFSAGIPSQVQQRIIVIEARDASPLADLIRAQAFPQSDDLRAQSFAAEFTLKTDHLVTLQAGAKARERLLVTFAAMLLLYRRTRTASCRVSLMLSQVGLAGVEQRLVVVVPTSASPAADLLRGHAFPQSDDLRAQSFAAEFTLETDHLVTLQAGAKA